MFKNYLLIAWRGLLRNKVYSFINIFGLAMGIACCLLLSLYIQDELAYDQHHARLGDLYRIVSVLSSGPMSDRLGTASPPIAPAMKADIPEVELAVRVLNPPGVQHLIRYEDKAFYETDGYLADSSVFELFTYDFKEGNPQKALTDPNTVVLSESLAKRMFGDEPALDKMVFISQGNPAGNYKVTGVFRENHASFLKARFFTSMMSDGWGTYLRESPDAVQEFAGQNFVPSYVRLAPGHDKSAVEKKMNEVLQKYGAASLKALGMSKTLQLEPVGDIYLRSDIGKSPRITYLYIIASIAAFILLIGCINFMNLSTAKAARRAAEIGIRKVMGAFRSALIRQILGEAMVIVVLAIALAVVLVESFLPWFNELTGKVIALDAGHAPYFILSLVVLTVVTGLVAGSYPAFYLSSFQPAQVLKGKAVLSSSTGYLRQGLVVFQFVIAILLVCGILIIGDQLRFMESTDLGFDAHAKIVLPLRTEQAQHQYATLRKELMQTAAVKAVSGTTYVPGARIWSDMAYYSEGKNMNDAVKILRTEVDAGYLEQMNIPLIAGRTFTDNRAMEGDTKVILNRAATTELGIAPDKIIGQHIYFDWRGTHYTFDVIGVTEDYHQTSLKDKIEPTVFSMPSADNQYGYMVVSVETADLESAIAAIGSQWKTHMSGIPYEYSFLDENIRRQYEDDRKVSAIMTSFTTIALVICCLGLYGLSSYMAERRFKEIGVRKVMGASVWQIVGLLSREFVRLVVVAFLIAVPMSWYFMSQWLQGFAYRVDINPLLFVLAGSVALAIALLTVSHESIRAASANPVGALRSE